MSTELDTLAVDIRHEIEQAEADFNRAVSHAIRAGELLIEAKAQVKHGQWLPWLEANFPASVDTAGNYMRLARNSERVRNSLSIRSALKELAPAKAETVDHLAEAKRLIDEADAQHRAETGCTDSECGPWSECHALPARRIQHEDVEEDLRRLFVRGEWRHDSELATMGVQIAWAVLGVQLYHLNKSGAPADYGYADLDEYLRERLPDVENAWRGLEAEMAVWAQEHERDALRPPADWDDQKLTDAINAGHARAETLRKRQ